MKSCLTLFIGFKASSRHLRAEFLDTDIPLNPIGHLRKKDQKLMLSFDPYGTVLYTQSLQADDILLQFL